MGNIIEVSHLVRRFGTLTAVDDISFNVREGDLFAFLGPNGAGKSTTINILCTLLQKSEGDVLVDGAQVGREDARVRGSIGVVFQDNVLDERLTVKENLLTRGSLYGLSGAALRGRFDEVADTLELGDTKNRKFGKLSGGQKRRAEIARALMGEPKLLFLDEPTTGLDPQTRQMVRQTLRRLRERHNMTLFLTTHYMEEAAEADDVAIIDHGCIVARGTPNELKEKHSSDVLRLAPRDMESVMGELSQMGREFRRLADVLAIQVKDSLEGYELLRRFEGRFSAFELVRGNMDDVFVNITGRRIREEN